MSESTKKLPYRSPIRVGNNVLVMTVTHYFTGRIVDVTRDEILLTEAAWVADTGRFHMALAGTAKPVEVEPCPPESVMSVARGSVVAVFDWTPALPLEVA